MAVLIKNKKKKNKKIKKKKNLYIINYIKIK